MTANGHINGKNGLWQSTKNGNPPARAREAEDVSDIYITLLIWGSIDMFDSS